MTLDTRTEVDGTGRLILHVHGDVDLGTETLLGQALTAALANRGVREVIVDLAGVPFLDSTGVRVLLEGRRAALARGAALTVRNPQRVVNHVLQVTGVAEALGLPGDVDRHDGRH
ncbi:anti-sigma B factor antagonist [Micromonospora pattaloongensis]|uniref:Anti-sigma factor antagonist n=1 Tax=Micromonospora pattaloongensis TaxID=405436 RepID=A0A1H3T7J6_9ACTN|nr:STAS domain-containing protein [Micromonospora pattaloongensis]SDZ45299.1 anti-sigma B factor antagonist [Micromonospora pattaloongensis]